MDDLDYLEHIVAHIHSVSNAPVILDAKYGDIGNTAKKYAQWAYHRMNVDAVTINGFMGDEAILPFVTGEWSDRMGFVLVKTTAKTSHINVQELELCTGKIVYRKVMEQLNGLSKAERLDNLGMVIGATNLDPFLYPLPINTWILCPGIGAQGGNLEEAVKNNIREDKSGLLINVGRDIIESKNVREKTLDYKDKINEIRFSK